MPLLEPHMCWLRGIDDLLPRYVFLVFCRQELEQLDPLLGVKLRSEGTTCNKLVSSQHDGTVPQDHGKTNVRSRLKPVNQASFGAFDAVAVSRQ